MLLLDCAFRELLEDRIIGTGDGTAVDGHFVEETIIRGRADAQVASVVFLRGLAENVGRRMPEYTLTWGSRKS